MAIIRLIGDSVCVSQMLMGISDKEPVFINGSLNYLRVPLINIVLIDEGLSTFGGPTPRALDYCIKGVGKYAEKLEIPFRLKDLETILPSDLREKVTKSNCIKYAFHTSKVNFMDMRKGIYLVNDTVLFLNLERHLKVYTINDQVPFDKVKKVKCSSSELNNINPTINYVKIPILSDNDYINSLYYGSIENFIYSVIIGAFLSKTRLRILRPLIRRLIKL